MFSPANSCGKVPGRRSNQNKTGEVYTEKHKHVLKINKIKGYSIVYVSLSLSCASSCLAQGLHYMRHLLAWSSGFTRLGFRAETLSVFVYSQLYN